MRHRKYLLAYDQGHPVAVHTLDNTSSVISDSHSLLAEIQALTKSKNKILGINGLDNIAVIVDAQMLNQAFVYMAKSEDVDL